MNKIKVLYIAGVNRSGTTLLGRVLGQSKNSVFVGEAKNISPNTICGCGKTLKECPEWEKIVCSLDTRAIRNITNKVRARDILLSPPNVADEVRLLNDYYSRINNQFNKKCIIDSSKIPSYLYVLSKSSRIDLKVIHIVRNMRDVVNSWWRRPLHEQKENRPFWERSYKSLKFENPIRAILIWMSWNISIRKQFSGKNYYSINYKQFCQSPRTKIRKALKKLKSLDLNPSWISENEIMLPEQHSVKGNPNRFNVGRTKIELN